MTRARNDAVAAVAAALTNSYDAGCGTMARRNRQDPRRQAETAVRVLIELGWTPPADPRRPRIDPEAFYGDPWDFGRRPGE